MEALQVESAAPEDGFATLPCVNSDLSGVEAGAALQSISPADNQTSEPTTQSPFPRWRLVPWAEGGLPPAFVPKRLRPGLNNIGREAGNHIILDSALVSRQHAKLVLSPHGAVVHDLDSHNGVFLEGTKVRSATVMLGQRLYIADVCCVLEPYDGDLEHIQLEEAIEALNLRPLRLRQEQGLPQSAQRPTRPLSRVVEMLCGSEDEDFFNGIAQIIRETLDADALRIWTLSGVEDLQLVASEGVPPKHSELEWELARRAVELQSGLVSQRGGGAIEGAAAVAERSLSTLCCLPLTYQERCHGALYVDVSRAQLDGSPQVVDFLDSVAHLVAARLDGATAHAHGAYEIRTLRERVRSLEHDLVQARAAVGQAPAALEQDTQVHAGIGQGLMLATGAMAEALVNALPARVASAVQSIAAGIAPGHVTAEMGTIFQIFLSGLDAWVMDVPPEALKARLDWLCDRVNGLCRPLGGEVEQSNGHGLLVRFPGDRSGVTRATRCALQLIEETAALGGQAQAGIHHGVDVSGVFGPTGTLMHAGEAVAVAKAASHFARPGTLYGGETIRDVMRTEADVVGVAMGPHFVHGLNEPVALYHFHRVAGGRP